mgnify:CR=1 FL=1
MDYRLDKTSENLNIIFGKKSFVWIIMPSLKPLPHDGIHWTTNTSNNNNEINANI